MVAGFLKNRTGQSCCVVWTQVGPQLRLRAEIMPKAEIVQSLGWVELRKDGRWDWHINDGWMDFFARPEGHYARQGVAMTETDAKRLIERIWRIREGRVCA